MKFTISGYSTALFSTWYFVEELNLLLDCGDGVISNLLQKSRKVENVFVTHADRDHLTGLLQFNQLNARPGFPVIHYPKDCGSFAALEEFSKKFDPHVGGSVWKPLVDGERTWIKKDIYVQAIRNHHVPCAKDVFKSFGYKVVQVKSKLKPEYLSLKPLEIRDAIEKLGDSEVCDLVETNLLSFSGDTPVENFEHWKDANVLIHEATFLGGSEDAHIQTHGNKHSNLEDVMRAVSQTNIKTLVLGHFSSRYPEEQIDAKIAEYVRKFGISIPVYRILPGQFVRNILKTLP